MTDVTENDLHGAIKALSDVIAPAIDPADPLALEQLRLVVEYLEFLRARFEFLPDLQMLRRRPACEPRLTRKNGDGPRYLRMAVLTAA